jgi:deazaflavin-dependent oxidoreductase (nitroreductase family)
VGTVTDIDRYAVIQLTTVGRVTGRPHTIEIWFASMEETIYMLSGGRERSDWVRNLISTPEVRVRAGGMEYPGLGRIVLAADEDRVARDAVYAKYSARYRGDLTEWRETALPVAVDVGVSISTRD